MLGARPHAHWRREREVDTPGSRQKSHSGPLQPTADHTPSRAAHCSLFRASLSFFRELPLLTRPHLAQPLLSSADPVGNGVFLSPLGVTVAALQPCSGMRDVSKYRVRLAPGSIPAHADPCEDYINIGMANNAVKVRLAYTTAAYSTPSRICRARTDLSPIPSWPV